MQTERVSLKEAIRRHGLEYLRGKPVYERGGRILFISDKPLDGDIELYADEPENAYQIQRFYGAEQRNAEFVCWIYTNSTLIDVPCIE